ncbi:MAG: tyrosine-type recombinase/integrase [Ruminococcus sp.]|nr:tyrosine-type recombinase/integrase [Ruminococcus sp.]
MSINYKECPDYLSDFLNHIRVIEDRTVRTEEAYYVDMKTFLRFLLIDNNIVDPNKTEFKDIDIKNVSFDLIKKFTLRDAYTYLRWLTDERNNSAKTRARKITCLRHFYSYLTNKAMLLPSNPIENLELPRTEKTLPKYLTLNEAQKLLGSIETKNTPRDYCIITLFLNCGMRLSELCGIDVDDINIENRSVRLFGKGRKERIVALNDACIAAVNNYLPYRLNEETTTDALFLSNRKTRITNRRVEQIVEECLKKAGLSNLGISTHKLRHTAATLMYQNGVDTLLLKEVLGHESTATTEIYTHINSANVRKAIESNPLADMKPKSKDNKNE